MSRSPCDCSYGLCLTTTPRAETLAYLFCVLILIYLPYSKIWEIFNFWYFQMHFLCSLPTVKILSYPHLYNTRSCVFFCFFFYGVCHLSTIRIANREILRKAKHIFPLQNGWVRCPKNKAFIFLLFNKSYWHIIGIVYL